MKKQPTYSDFKEASPEELRQHYGLNSRQLEQAHRKAIDGLSRRDIEREYKQFYEDQRK